MRLIDKVTAIDNIYDAAENIICAVEEGKPEIAEKIVNVRDAILKKIEEQTTVEPEVRHGRWIPVDCNFNGESGNYCSNCDFFVSVYTDNTEEYNFCPNCGARMDGDLP